MHFNNRRYGFGYRLWRSDTSIHRYLATIATIFHGQRYITKLLVFLLQITTKS